MPLFLSSEWFDLLESTLATITIGASGETGLALGQVVHDCPQGTTSYTICIGAGQPGSLVKDSVATAQVTLVENYPVALAIHQGASVAELLASGQIKIRGDANALLRASKELAALADALSIAQDRQ
ncbi:MAG TPA: hypothetical protein VMU99_10270 [Acidimicrobiales bacterium]|nr:hypothetical protein [Acidimicrobiales bacterium]